MYRGEQIQLLTANTTTIQSTLFMKFKLFFNAAFKCFWFVINPLSNEDLIKPLFFNHSTPACASIWGQWFRIHWLTLTLIESNESCQCRVITLLNWDVTQRAKGGMTWVDVSISQSLYSHIYLSVCVSTCLSHPSIHSSINPSLVYDTHLAFYYNVNLSLNIQRTTKYGRTSCGQNQK